ncbi:MAG: hypothetical protein AAF393_09745 [Pseudomonadota bacterium]
MLTIFADSFLTASRLNDPYSTTDYRQLYKQPNKSGDRKVSKGWFFLS